MNGTDREMVETTYTQISIDKDYSFDMGQSIFLIMTPNSNRNAFAFKYNVIGALDNKYSYYGIWQRIYNERGAAFYALVVLGVIMVIVIYLFFKRFLTVEKVLKNNKNVRIQALNKQNKEKEVGKKLTDLANPPKDKGDDVTNIDETDKNLAD